MRKSLAKRVVSLVLAIVTMLSLVTPAFAAYKLTPPNPKDDGKFIISKTTPQAGSKKIWVLSQFQDADIERHWAIRILDGFRENGVAIGSETGILFPDSIASMSEVCALFVRYLYSTDYRATSSVTGKSGTALWGGDYYYSGSVAYVGAEAAVTKALGSTISALNSYKSPGSKVSYPGISGTLTRANAFYLYAVAALALNNNPGKILTSFSSTKLGYYYDNKTELKTKNGQSVNSYFVSTDAGKMTPAQIQAANLLMYQEVLQGGDGGRGLVPEGQLKRCEALKLLNSIKDVNSGEDIYIPDPNPPISNINPSLDIPNATASINYRDFEDAGKVSVRIKYDPTSSSSNMPITKYSFIGQTTKLGAITDETINSGSLRAYTETVWYTKTDLNYRRGIWSYKDTVAGTLSITDSLGASKTDTAAGSVNITVYNNAPTASFVARTDMLTGKNPDYSQDFFYVGKPVTITDSSSDYEAPLDETAYEIRKDGVVVAIVYDFAAPEFLDDCISEMTASGQKIHLTFKTPGVYTIRAIATDECGEQDVATKTIRVTGIPAKPSAIIKANNYAFIGTPASVKDASTDPNDDIVKWTWTDPLVLTEKNIETPEAPVAEDEMTWEPATGKYSKTYRDGAGATKPSYVDGTITFTQIGVYQLGLTVEDATGLTDSTTHEIKVIKDIPVPTPEPGPEDEHFPYMDGDTLVVKQNRLFTINIGNSLNPPSSPIQWDKTEWLYGTDTGYIMNHLKVDTASKDTKVKRFVPTEPGEFYITIVLHNPYSDGIAATDPTNEDLAARTAVVKVRVVADEPPAVAIQVNNANPNFHDNPSSINVKVVATANSPDFDTIDHYDWKLVRDSNNNGNFNDDAVLQDTKNSKQSEIGFTVKFTNGNTSPYQASTTVTEAFGQPTIPEFVDASDYLTASASATFDVNWTPCVNFKMRDWAYTDDVLTITTLLKDENVQSCKVDWSLWKKTGQTYTQVDTAAYDTWQLQNSGGQIRIQDDGYYRLQAVITDAEGHTETFYPDTDIRIYHLPVAVISDGSSYRWDNTIFNFKESRKFTLDGNASIVDDSTGAALHQLDRTRDIWTITPLDGQMAESIYVMNDAGTSRMLSNNSNIYSVGANKFDETLAILTPGRYEVSYQVTNTYGKKSPVAKQIITIAEDKLPEITGECTASVARGEAAGSAKVPLTISFLRIQSKDQDLINNYTISYVYDSDNDGSYTDETWTPMTQVALDNHGIPVSDGYGLVEVRDGYVEATVWIERSEIGKYRFKVWAQEAFGQETLPIVPITTRKEATKYFDTEVDNVAPNGTFSTRSIVKGDVVFAVGQSVVAEKVTDAINSFKNRFGSEAGLDLMDIRVDTVETSTVTAETKFPWKVYNLYNTGFGGGDGQFQAVGTDYYYRGYGSEAPIDHLYYDDGRSGTRKFTFDIDMTGYNSCATVIPAFLFGCKEVDANTFTGYISMMWHDKISVYSFTSTNGHSGFTSNGSGNIATSGGLSNYIYNTLNFTFIKSAPTVSTSLQKSVTMKYEGGMLTVTDGVKDILSVSCSSTGTGYGVAAVNSGHGCGERSYTKFKKFALETGSVKNLDEALQDVSWRDGAERFVIYLSDDPVDSMSPESGNPYASMLAMLLDQNVHLIGLGTSTNKAQIEKLLTQLDSAGLYIPNNPAENALNGSAEFIKQVLRKKVTDQLWVIAGESIAYNKIYQDFNGDPQWLYEPTTYDEFQKNPSILAQKWRYAHDETYYDNSMGKASFDNEWMAKEINTFDKVGLYYINYRIKDNPVRGDNSPNNPFDSYRYWSSDYDGDKHDLNGNVTNPPAELRVHRRPIADFTFKVNKVNGVVDSVTITDTSYDLDHQYTDPGRGINRWEWKWKFADDDGWRGEGTFESAKAAQDWINSELVGLRSLNQSNIMIQYRVRDIDGPLGVDEKPSVTAKPVMKQHPSSPTYAFYNPAYKQNITSIRFSKSIVIPTNATASWDVSAAGDKGVMAWVVSDGAGGFSLTIGAKGGPIAPTNMSYMFADFPKLEYVDFTGLNSSGVTSIAYLFRSCVSLVTVNASTLNTSNVIYMNFVFYNCSNATTINMSGWDTSNVATMNGMFSGCKAISQLDIGHFKTVAVTNFADMFFNCLELTSLDVSKWNTGMAWTMDYMFYSCQKIATLDVSEWNTKKVTSMTNMFSNCQVLTTLDVSKWDTGMVQNMNFMFYECRKITMLDVSKWNTKNVTSMIYMFYCSVVVGNYSFSGTSSLRTLNVGNWDVSKVQSFSGAFYGCWLLSSLDVGRWNTISATDTSSMFAYCHGLSTIDVSNWKMGKVKYASSMFAASGSSDSSFFSRLTTIDVSKWDTSSMENISSMFQWLPISTLDVSKWNTSKVTDMSMFIWACMNIYSLDISNWDVRNVTTFYGMFQATRCGSLDFSKWSNNKAYSVAMMFNNAYRLGSIDLSWLDFTNISDIGRMFEGTSSLGAVYVNSQKDYDKIMSFGCGVYLVVRPRTTRMAALPNSSSTPVKDDGTHGGLPAPVVLTDEDIERQHVASVSPVISNAPAEAANVFAISVEDRKHIQGAWSQPNVVWITNEPIRPVARFTTDNVIYDLGTEINVEDSSYSPNGDNIAKWAWTVTRTSTNQKTMFSYTLGSGGIKTVADMNAAASTKIFAWIDAQQVGETTADNTYKISLVVTDDKPIALTSDMFSVTIRLVPNNTPPTVTPPTTDPNDPGGTNSGNNSIFSRDNPTVYEYDAYDAALTNPYYKYSGNVQKRGSEQLDWSILIDDADNHDKYGPGNDSNTFKVGYKLERFESITRKTITALMAPLSAKEYPAKTVSIAQAAISSNVAPFTSSRAGALTWGTYRIVTSVTDIPNNDMTGKTTTMTTNPTIRPVHLYVIPKLDVSNAHYVFNGIEDNPERIAPGDIITVSVQTNDRSFGTRLVFKDGSGQEYTQEMTGTPIGDTDMVAWSTNFTIPGNLEDEDLFGDSQYSFEIETYTNYGAQAGEETRTKKTTMTVNILPLRLYGFEITGITDPAIKYTGYPVPVPHLAFDSATYSTLMKKGYAVNFNVYSKGLRGDTDGIRIRPTFYGYNTSTGRYDMLLDMYYKNTDDMYVLATTNPNGSSASGDDFEIYKSGLSGTLLGTLRELNLTVANRTMIEGGSVQQWSARYGIPGSAVFVRQGQTLDESNLYSGGVLVVFDIDAMKNGSPKYNYIGKGQWDSERKDSSGRFIVPGKAIYQDGAIIVMDSGKSALDNYESRPVWTKH